MDNCMLNMIYGTLYTYDILQVITRLVLALFSQISTNIISIEGKMQKIKYTVNMIQHQLRFGLNGLG